MADDRNRDARSPGRRGSVRVRTTVGALVVVGIALIAGSAVLVELLRQNLTAGVHDGIELRAEELAATVTASGIPASPPVGDAEDQIIQILDPSGRVRASSENIAGKPPIATLRPRETTEVSVSVGSGRFLVYAASATSGGQRLTILAAASLEDVIEPTRTLTRMLLIGVPVLLLVVGITTWRVTGRALAPVDAMRAEVDAISAAELHRRLADPPRDDEIARLARTMNRMLDRLEQAQARQRRFVSDASHELRSPIAAIRQHVEVALAHPDRTTAADLAGIVLAEDLRVQRLIDDLLLLARADEGKGVVDDHAVDLDDVVFDEAKRLRETSAARVDTTDVSAGRIRGDAGVLGRAVRNLGENAARHARGVVTFSLRTRDGTVVLSIEDDGAGIPPADRGRVFDRFVRLDDARSRDEGGAGLGLAIVSEVVRMHGGTVTAGEGRMGGARFEITFPSA